MQVGDHSVALIGAVHAAGSWGGLNLSGAVANGIPRNLFTVAVADGREVVVPMIGPDGRTTTGLGVGDGVPIWTVYGFQVDRDEAVVVEFENEEVGAAEATERSAKAIACTLKEVAIVMD